MILLKEGLFQGFSLLMIGLGLAIGFLLRHVVPITQDQMNWVKVPGDLLFDMLEFFAIPLIVTRVIAEVTGLKSKLPGKTGIFTTTYICGSTILAVSIGMTLVILVKPGMDYTDFDRRTVNTDMPSSSMHVLFMDIIRNIVPESFVQAFYERYKTEIIPVQLRTSRRLSVDPSVKQNGTEMQLRGKYVAGANMIGLIFWSFTIGFMLNRVGIKAKATVKFIRILSNAITIIYNWMLWYLPIGLLFLVLEHVLDIDDWSTFMKLVRYIGVLFLGLGIHSFLVLPLIYFVFTQRNPFLIFIQVSKALFTSLLMGSSAATLPITIQCCEENLKANARFCKLMLPIVATINMNGLALYEVISIMFFAQMSDILLDFSQLITICLTCCISSFAAVGVPATGYAATVLIFTSAGLPAHNASLLLLFEWFLGHFTTIVNVLGDCYGAALISHLCKDELLTLDKLTSIRPTTELELDLLCLESDNELIPSSSAGGSSPT
ncbi:excitatory amino acid transporter 3-like isoform X2 [Poeciliopsis prolifica]|uniref:excitatory amino acid transporter 3-like isoform X2 n=1 Tax=Poeciliopsis prolifica TaxID=188132 RepID=UPI0024140A90|nr:excitatory amino acid transporter 3-like isoform X2 [Poeciliopsis prolifica]